MIVFRDYAESRHFSENEGGRLMSSRIFQSVVEQLAEASQKIIGVIDAEGTVISSIDSSLSVINAVSFRRINTTRYFIILRK